MDSVQDIIQNLLQNLASRKEIEQYLREFTGVESTKFAVIKVGGGILAESRDDLASALAFLRRVGLFPIVVHGAGPQLDAALVAEGITTRSVDGLRVTTPEVLAIARRVFQHENLALVHALEERQTRARPILSGVFEASTVDADRLGLVGAIDRVDLHPILASIEAGQLPIVSSLGETDQGQILNINADVATRELALAVQPYKVIFLTPTGGLLDDHGHIIPAVNLVEDFDRLMSEPWVNGGMALKLKEIRALLDRLPPAASISITAPHQLARELFTHRGSGTLIRRGTPVDAYDGIDGVDISRLRTLVEVAFGRALVDDYFDTRTIERALVAHDYSAAAIITTEGGHPYLDKFAVTAAAQGAGLGTSVWNRLRQETPRLFWRSRPDNPITPWYFRHAGGMHRTDDWIVFWYGLRDRDEIEHAITTALAVPPSLTDPASTSQEPVHA
jgi:acetylglutamate kinase